MSYLSGLTNLLFMAIITLKKRSDSSTITIRLTSQELPTLQDNNYIYYPLLKEVSNLTEDHDLFMPRSSEGTITIDNDEGSFGYNRKFSDILDYYAIVEQEVIIEVRKIKDAFTTFNTPLQSWAFKCSSIDADLERGEIKLKLRNNAIPDRVLTKEINSSDFPDAPAQSLGKYLPLVIGNDVNVIGTPTNTNVYSLMTIPDGYTYNAISTNLFFEKALGLYLTFEGVSTTSVYPLGNTWGTDASAVSLGKGKIFAIQEEDFLLSNESFLIHNIDIYLKGTGAASAQGNITVSIGILKDRFITRWLRRNPPIPVVTPDTDFKSVTEEDISILATATINKADFSASYMGGANFYQTFQFPIPVRIGNDLELTDSVEYYSPLKKYCIIVKDSNPTTTPVDYTARDQATAVWDITDDGVVLGNLSLRYRCKGVTRTITTSSADINSLKHTYVTLASSADPSLNYSYTSYMFNISGLTASSDLKNTPAKLMPLILGSSLYDDTSLASTHTAYANRVLSGQTTGKTTRLGLLPTLMKNSASRLISTASKGSAKLALYAYGTEVPSSYILKQDRIRSFKYTVANRTTVINNITANYKKDIIEFNALDIETQRQSAGYSRTLGNQRLSGSQSITLYGQNDLANSGFEFIGDDTSMLDVIDYYLTDKEHPEINIEVAINYDPADPINELLASKRITLITPKLPNFLGTNQKVEKIYSEDIEEITENAFGTVVIAKSYLCELKSKKLQYRRGTVELVLNLRLCNI